MHVLCALAQVYVFGRGNVKPADKRYSRVRNDYALHFDTASELDACGKGQRGMGDAQQGVAVSMRGAGGADACHANRCMFGPS